jgi:ABC-type multidrug transport system fused ATPase/permease subunit
LASYYVSGLIGLLTILLLSICLSWRTMECQQRQLERRDRRLQRVIEAVNHIKVIKFNAWESVFERCVGDLRRQELAALQDSLMLQAMQSFLWNCAIFLVAFLSFATYALLNTPENRLTAQRAFVSVAVFNSMRSLFRMVPSCIASWSQGWVSVSRIDQFLLSKELNSSAAATNYNNNNCANGNKANGVKSTSRAIKLKNCGFTRADDCSGEEIKSGAGKCLNSITLSVAKGELVGVIGHMGSGKTTLLEALAGEHQKSYGAMEVADNVVLVENTPWLMSGTIRDNIVFGSSFTQSHYDCVVRAVRLEDDFKRMPLGDQTWLHNGGENLSGGQRQRIGFARAVYRNAAVYLLDDALSAVDPRLRSEIFAAVVGTHGMLRNRTRVAVVNEHTLVECVDKLVLMHEQTVADVGTPTEVRSRHNLDLEVWQNTAAASEEDAAPEEGGRPRRMDRMLSRKNSTRPLLRRGDTLSINEVIRAMKAKSFESADDIIGMEGVTADNYIYYAKYLGMTALVLGLIGFVVSQVFEVAAKFWLASWTFNEEKGNFHADNDFIIVYGSLGVCQALAFLAAVLQINQRTLEASNRMHADILGRVLHSSMSFVWSTPVGAIANRFARDTNEVDFNLPSTLKSFLFQSIRICGTLFLVVFTFPANVFPFAVLALGFVWLFKSYIRISRLFKRLSATSLSDVNAAVSETVSGASTVRTFRASAFAIERCERSVDAHQKHCYMEFASDCWLFVRLQFVTGLFLTTLTLLLVLFRYDVTSQAAGLCLTSALVITADSFLFTRYAASLEKSMVSVERMAEYNALDQEGTVGCLANGDVANGATGLFSGKLRGDILMKKLTVRYPGRGSVCLKDVSVSIKAGEKVGVVGRTGAGKSSVALALFRMLERLDGELLIDGTDINSLDLARHRSRITIIPQVRKLL